jgi:hypothetical protein
MIEAEGEKISICGKAPTKITFYHIVKADMNRKNKISCVSRRHALS